MIHLHERYGIVQHTTDLGEKFVEPGYVTIVPDLFSRFTGDRDELATGDDRCDLDDEQVLRDIDAVVEYLRGIPEVDMSADRDLRRVPDWTSADSHGRQAQLYSRRVVALRRCL